MSNTCTVNNIINNRNRNCFECRLLSGGGLVAAGSYVYYHSKQYHNRIGKMTMYSIASGMFSYANMMLHYIYIYYPCI